MFTVMQGVNPRGVLRAATLMAVVLLMAMAAIYLALYSAVADAAGNPDRVKRKGSQAVGLDANYNKVMPLSDAEHIRVKAPKSEVTRLELVVVYPSMEEYYPGAKFSQRDYRPPPYVSMVDGQIVVDLTPSDSYMMGECRRHINQIDGYGSGGSIAALNATIGRNRTFDIPIPERMAFNDSGGTCIMSLALIGYNGNKVVSLYNPKLKGSGKTAGAAGEWSYDASEKVLQVDENRMPLRGSSNELLLGGDRDKTEYQVITIHVTDRKYR